VRVPCVRRFRWLPHIQSSLRFPGYLVERTIGQLGIHATTFLVTPDPAGLARLAGLTDSGQLRPVVSPIFPLREGREAFESGARPHPPGKTVLLVH
jgi:NADPH:quinone reductase-like Zn-dependent oxidoreductase